MGSHPAAAIMGRMPKSLFPLSLFDGCDTTVIEFSRPLRGPRRIARPAAAEETLSSSVSPAAAPADALPDDPARADNSAAPRKRVVRARTEGGLPPAVKLDDLYRLPMPKLFNLAEREGITEHTGMNRAQLIVGIVRKQIERGEI